MSNKALTKTNWLTSLVLLVIFIIIYCFTLDMTARERAFPQTILQLLIAFDILLFFVSGRPSLASLKLVGQKFIKNLKNFKIVILKYIIPTIVYFFLIKRIGFFPASLIYFVATAYMLGTKLKAIIIGSTCVILFSYLIFTYFLGIRI